MADLTTPVAFILFNRPDKTERAFARIREARPSQLFLIADGPRPGHPTDMANCAAARAVVEQVDWPCEVEQNYAGANLGCRNRVASGLDWVFERVEAAIILEDDILPDLTFFAFAQELLHRFRDDSRIMHICGRNQLGHQPQDPYSYFFSRLPNIWGWGTWRRAWCLYDIAAKGWTNETQLLFAADPVGRTQLPRWFSEVQRGAVDTWDYQWMLQVMLQSGLSVIPTRNLVQNIGYGSSATHTHNPNHRNAKLPSAAMYFPLVHPPYVRNNPIYDEQLLALLRRPSLLRRAGYRLENLIRSIRRQQVGK